MADTNFVDKQTVIQADWLNDVNDNIYGPSAVVGIRPDLNNTSDSTKGDTLIGVTAPGGGKPQTQHDKNAQSINVAEYVLSADAGDHALAWKRAIVQANGRPLDVSGSWTFLTAVDASGYDVNFFGVANIDATAVAAAYPLLLGGTEGSASALGADVSAGAAGISCSLTVSPGDTIKLVSTDLWSPERSYYYKGELARVSSVSGGTIFLQSGLNDSYTAATTTVTKINTKKVAIQDQITINRQSDLLGGVLVQWSKDIYINKLAIVQARERGIYIKECLGGSIIDSTTVASFPVGGATNYGLIIDSSAEVAVVRGNYHGGRHGISTGGTYPSRDLIFDRVIVNNDSSSSVYCLDAHANGERFVYQNIIVKNAALLQAINISIFGGLFKTVNIQNVLNFSPSKNNTKYLIDGAFIDGSNFTNSRGIILTASLDNLNLGSIVVTGGTRLHANNPFMHFPFATGTTTINEVLLNGIEAIATGTTSTSGIYVGVNTQNPNVTLFRLINSKVSNTANGPNISLLSGAVTFGEVQIMNNQMTQSGANNVAFVQRASLAKIHGNTCYGNSTALRFELNTCVDTDVQSNKMYGFTSNGGILLNGSTGQDVAINNSTDAAAGFTFPAGTIIGFGANNRRIFMRTALPSSGTYLIGDRIIHSTPTTGQPKGWGRATNGTGNVLGTDWLTEGNY